MTSFDYSAPKPTFIEKLNNHLTSLELENSPLTERFGKGKYRDYLKFHYLLAYEKNQRQPQPLHPSPSPSDQLVFELDHDLELDEEEENNPDDLTFLKDMSAFSSKKSSIFTLNPASKKGSLLVPNTSTRHYSLRSDFGKKRDSLLPNFQAMIKPKRSSALVEAISQTEEDLKKRNSAILDDISSKLVSTQKTSTKKSLFEKIKRSSLRCNLSLSSLKSSDNSSNHSHESVNHRFIEEDDGFTESDDSASQSGSDDESDFEDPKDEGYIKISFLKYENKKFKENKLGNEESVGNLKKMNLLYNFFEEPVTVTSFAAIDGKTNIEAKGEQRFRKFNIPDKKYSKYQPYYLLNPEGIVKHRYKRPKRGKKNLYIARKEAKIGMEEELDQEKLEKVHLEDNESVFELGSIVPDDVEQIQKGNYRFYVSQGETSGSVQDDLKTPAEAYSMNFANGSLYSQSVNLKALEDSTAKPHFQLKLVPSNPNSAVLVENSLSQPVVNNYFEEVQAGFCSNMVKEFSEENLCHARDCGSKRGTFVKLKQNDPLTLQEGQLFLLNNRIGFYIKRQDDQHELESQENLIYETICINKKTSCEPIVSLAIPETKSSTTEMKTKSPKDSPGDLKELLEGKHCASIKLELVRWNENLEFYEEQGTIAFVYNSKEAIGCFEEGLLSANLDYTTKNWIDLAEGSKFFGQIIKRLSLDKQILLVYDTNMNSWHLEMTAENQGPTYGIVKNVEKMGQDQVKEDAVNEFMIPPLIKEKVVEESSLAGLWLSISPFDILQEEFGIGWTKISVPSVMMFEDIVFKVTHEVIPTLYKA